MDVTSVVAANAKAIREEKKLTLDGAAAATGVSRSMLAQIEKGEVNPTISVLWKIANGYKVSFTSLVERHGEKVCLVRAGELTPLLEDQGRYENYPIFPFEEGNLFETYRIVIKPGGTLSARPHLAGAEEYITVFTGTLELQVGEEHYDLREGDSIRFRADVPHCYENPGQATTQLSMMIHYQS